MDETIISTLLLPSERPPIDLDIKRSLLTFDQVHLTNPDDRELIDPIQLMPALTGSPVPAGIHPGEAVMPLGKHARYDQAFESLLEECKAALDQGSVVVDAKPSVSGPGQIFIGYMPPPAAGWANPRWVMLMFRLLIAQKPLLLQASRGLPAVEELMALDLNSLAPGGAALTRGAAAMIAELRPHGTEQRVVAGPPVVHDLNDGSLPQDIADAVARMAIARVGSVIKYAAICQNRGLHPTSSDPGISAILQAIQRAAGSSLAEVLASKPDHDVVRRVLRVERIVFSHELPDAVLAQLSMSELLRLRTKAWGRAGVARSEFFFRAQQLAAEASTDEAFDAAVRGAINDYRKAQSDLADELRKVGLKLGLPALAGTVVATVEQSAIAMPAWGMAVVLAATTLKDVVDECVAIMRARSEIASSTGKALLEPYNFALRK